MTAEPNSSHNTMVVLSKSTLNAAKFLGLSHTELAQLLGISELSVSQLEASTGFIDPCGHEGERAVTLIRIFRALDALVGGDEEARITWMSTQNSAIGDVPKQAIQTFSGLVQTMTYLENLPD